MTKRHHEGTKNTKIGTKIFPGKPAGHRQAARVTPQKSLRASFVGFVSSWFLLVAAGSAADVFPAKGGDVTLTPFVHSSVQIEHAGKVIQVDPWSVADLSAARPADLILITDDPVHHLDVTAIAKLRKPGAPIVLTANGLKRLPDGLVMKNGERRDVAGIPIEAVAAYDLTPGEPYHPKGEGNGYIVTVGGLRIYFAGVSACVPEIKALRDIDIAFFPLNLPVQRMEPDAAVACIRAFRPRVVYPYHYDQDWVTRVGRGEPGGAPTTRGLQELKTALAADGIDVRLADWYRSREVKREK
jgi:L-ascorbate metabolism protein UlaG (beta-lactamase superfamily)